MIKSVFFATFAPWEKGKRMPTNGMIEPMTEFFTSKVDRFILLDNPHPGSSNLFSIIEVYEKGKLKTKVSSSIFIKILKPFLNLTNSVGTQIPFKLRDFLSIFDFVVRDRKKYDLFIGLESVHALAGVILKKVGLVKIVVYYVSDYSPQRYSNKFFNKIYLSLDRCAVANSDYVWDVSKAMMGARIKVGLDKKYESKRIHVPNALYPEQIDYLPMSKIQKNTLVYAGTLGVENGPDIAIRAIALAAKKIPTIKLHIFGGGEKDLKRLKALTQKLKAEKNIEFRGFFTDQKKLSKEIKKLAVGIAPYKAIPGSPRWWADATKIRLYLAAGQPVITTQVPPLGKEVQDNNAGIITKDKPSAMSEAIIRILKDQKSYKKYRKNAINMASDNLWENTYSAALKGMDIDL